MEERLAHRVSEDAVLNFINSAKSRGAMSFYALMDNNYLCFADPITEVICKQLGSCEEYSYLGGVRARQVIREKVVRILDKLVWEKRI